MIHLYIQDKDIHSLRAGITDLNKNHDIQGLLILSCHANQYDSAELNQLLKEIDLPITGAICLELIYEGHTKQEGAIIVGFTESCTQVSIEDLERDELSSALSLQNHNAFDEYSTVFVFVDALAPKKDLLIESLYNSFGLDANYIGGAAASLSFEPFPCVYSSQGLLESGASIMIVDVKSSIGVSHGWESISRTLKVTEVRENEIISLDWEPAFEVYKSIIEEHSKRQFDDADFFNHTKSYPFGIAKLDSEMIVRDPFKQENGTSVFTLDNIEEGSHICVLYGNMDGLLKGAEQAKLRAETNSFENSQRIIIDCISRVLYMGDQYSKELQILDPDKKALGACTFGEIANSGDSFLEIYNKTAVVGQIKTS